MEIILYSIVLFLLTLASGYCAGTETALFSLSPMLVKSYKHDPNPRKRLIAKLVLHPRDLLVTIFMLNTLANILIQNVSSNMFGPKAGWALKIGVPLFITLVLGDIIPKNIGMQANVKLSYLAAPSIDWLNRMLAGVRKLIIYVTVPISRVMFFFLKREDSLSKEELKHVLKTSEKYGIVQPDEAELIDGYLTLQESSVKELMRPREDILYYEINEPLSKLIYLLVDKEVSRIPVCDKDIDHVIGIISARQYFIHRDELRTPEDLKMFMIKPFFIPESTSGRALLRRFDETLRVFALVVDEYGSISGLITREDLIETVIGEIKDRRDEKTLYTRAGKNEIIASGKLELSALNEIFDTELDSPANMVTVGGWLIEQLGEIPKSGTKLENDDFFFQVLASDPNRIRRIYIRKLNKGREI